MTEGQRRALFELLPTRAWPLDGRPVHAVTGRHAPLTLEIGTGNGENLLALARQHPDEDFLACEVHGPGVGHLLLETEAHGLRNVWVAHGDVHDLLQRLPAASLTTVNLFFPDPWPKTRHHKRRIFQRPLLDALAQRLARHGRFYVATDIDAYAEWVLEQLGDDAQWVNLAGPGREAPRPHHRILTRFEARARRDGRRIHDFLLGLR